MEAAEVTKELLSSPQGCHSSSLLQWRQPFQQLRTGLGSCCLAGRRAAPHLWLLIHSCVQALQNTKRKNATCSKWAFEQLTIIRSEKSLFVCSGLSVSTLFCTSRASVQFQKKWRHASIYSYFSGMGRTGKINTRKVAGNENPGKYKKLPKPWQVTYTWTVCATTV